MSETQVQPQTETTRPLIEDIELTPLDLKGALVPYDASDFFSPKPKPFWRRWYDFPALVLAPVAIAAAYLF